MATVGSVIRDLREERGLSQSALARIAGLSGSHISQLEGDERTSPSFETVAAICAALGVSLDTFAHLCGLPRYAKSGDAARAHLARVEREAVAARAKLQRAVEAYEKLDETLRER